MDENSTPEEEADQAEVESPAPAQDPGADDAEVDPGESELKALRDEVARLNDDALRAKAEADNVRKRATRDVEAAHRFGSEKLINLLLPLKDSMDLGLDAATSASEIETIREGMELTAKMFEDVLEKTGVSALDPLGEPFDPEFHQAMTMEESSDAEPGTVMRVMQKGYLLNDRLLRPALVIVAKAPSE